MKRIKKRIGKLIDAVRRYPYLYDTNHEDYKDTRKKMLAWREIAEEVDMNNYNEAKAKWRNLRDCYMKWKKNEDLPPESHNKYKKWPWGHQMEFLSGDMTAVERRFSESNTERSESSISIRNIKVEVTDSDEFEEPVNTKKYENCEHTPTRQMKVIEHSQSRSTQQETDHVHNLFLSYADTFKKMSKNSQIELKLKMAQIFAEAEMYELNSAPARSSGSGMIGSLSTQHQSVN